MAAAHGYNGQRCQWFGPYSLAHVGGMRASRVPNRWRRRAVRVLALVVVFAVLATVAVASRWAWQDGRLNTTICGGDCGPTNVIAPEGLRVAGRGSAETSVAPQVSPIDPDAVVAAVKVLLTDSVLGPHVGFAAVAPAPGGQVSITDRGDGTVFTPASTTKLLTGLAALSAIDPQTRFLTTVVDTGDQIVLVGGGDPYLIGTRDKNSASVERGELAELAERTAAALSDAGRTSVTLGFDDTLFTGPAISKGWEDTYVPGNIVTPVNALWVDQGVVDGTRARDPAQSAATQFAELLDAAGIDVTGDIKRASAPDAADVVATVSSATIEQIVQAVIRTSDNQAAEVLLRQVGLASDRPGSFDGGIEATIATLQSKGIDTAGLTLFDGSGLSRRNLISPSTLVDVVREALATPRGAALVDDLPISGFTGTLANRFDATTRGLVRAKTGTLTGIHSLAGYALDADGRPVVFAVMADDTSTTDPFKVQDTLDDIAAAIATCSCG